MFRIIITASSFCANPELRAEAQQAFRLQKLTFKPLDPHTPESEVAAALAGHDAAIIGREKITSRILDVAHPPRVLAKYGVGLDNIDPALAGKIEIVTAAGINAFAVAEHTVGLILSVTHNIARCDRMLRSGQWWKNGGTAIAGKRVAIIGVGHVGTRVARILRAMECQVVGVDVVDKKSVLEPIGARQVELAEALAIADIVTLHVPLTPLTKGLVNHAFLAQMRPGAALFNTSRGKIVVEIDLVQALRSGCLAGAGLDVFEVEPTENNELLGFETVICTPHTAGNSREAVLAMGRQAISGLRAALENIRKH